MAGRQFRAGDQVRYRHVDHPAVDAVIWSHGPRDGTWWIIPDRKLPDLVQGCYEAHHDGITLFARYTAEATP